MAYTKYSLTPSSNTAAPPDGAPEGMLPSAVNDTMRDMMAQIRDCGDGIRDGTYTMTAPIITGGTINGATIGATTASTGKFTAVTNSALTSGRVTYAGTAGVLQDDADFTFNGTTVTMANDASISGLTVGKGGGAVASNTGLGASVLTDGSVGVNNTAIGYQALKVSQTNNNTAVGSTSMVASTTGAANTALGVVTLYTNTTGSNNVALGYAAMYYNTTGATNVAIGRDALQNNTTASNNTAVGYQAGYSQTTGSGGNTHLGYQTGYYVTTGANNTFIGNSCGIAASPTGQVTTGSNIVGIGDNNVANAYIKVAWTVTSDARDKADIQDANYGLSFVNSLRPVVFKWDDRSNYKNWISDGSKKKNKTQIGFLAQDVIALEKENGAIGGDFLIADDNNLDALKLTETKLIPVLVKAIQELKAEVDSLKAQLNNGA